MNPVVYFEIPVTVMERAITFYTSVFGFSFAQDIIDQNDMAFFPFEDGARGITGALAKGEIYTPTVQGILVYFGTNNIDSILQKAIEAGGEVLYPKTSNGELGYVAEFKDCEGNRIALHQK